jgi:tRNA A-37 threonylcarbamoyl transferase component Bud32
MLAACETLASAVPPRAALEEHVVARLQHGRWRAPDVLLVEGPAGPVVVKDFAPRSPWLRQTLGRLLVWRELRAYRALQGHPAVPRLLGPLDAFAFAIEYRPGERMTREITGRVSAQFATALEDAVRSMHDRGVAHLDLRHRSNVLVGEDGEPVLIDFASAICFRPGGLAARWLLPLFAHYDLRAVEKWRRRLHHVWPAFLRARELKKAGAEPASPRSGGTSRE